MLPYFWYLLKVTICSGILFGYYWLLLRNKIFHRYNRFYLLAAMSLSLVLPLLKINFWQPASQSQAIKVLQVVSAGDDYMNNIVVTAHKNHWSFDQLYPLVYFLVSAIFLLVMIRTLYLIRTLLKNYPVQQIEEVAFVNTNDDSTPFSFFKYIFWNNSIDMATTTGRQIFKHEVAHIQEKHTHDKLFVNIVLIFYWCNPFFWLYRKELNMIHEFIADKKAVEDSDTSAFAAMILQAAYPKHRFELTNNFFYSPIKRRLRMLTKIDNPRISYFARIMVLPLAVLIFAAFTFKAKTSTHLYNGKKITVVINAGHGGIDNGAKGIDGVLEKNITLELVKKIKELNTNDAIEIILTKEKDIFESKEQIIEFKKNQNASLYISVHAAIAAENKSGMEVFIAKDGFPYSMQSRLLGSAIVNEFKQNYGLPVSTQLVQRHLWTLEKNRCPSVYIETGLISNQNDLNYLQSEKGQETIAKNVLAAIEKFANSYTQFNQPVTIPVSDTLPNKIPVITSQKGKNPLYILNDNKVDSNVFHKLNPNEILSINVLKDNAAIAKYGDEGKGGVIIIKTKNYQQKTGEETIDPEKVLVIVNGKIIGKGSKRYDEQFSQLYAKSITVKWLKKTEAIAKYGTDGSDGACEFNYTEGATFTTAYVDRDKISVFYIGMDNPFTVQVVNVKPEDLVVNISEGSVSGINGKYNARVNTTGEVTLRLSKRDGTLLPATITVNVKRLPDPNDPDFPSQLKLKIKAENMHALELKQKEMQEQQAKANLDLAEITVEGRKMTDQEIQNLKQKELIKKQAFDASVQKEALDKKMSELDLQKQKYLLEKQALDANKEKVVEGKKIEELQLQKQKQNLVLDELSKNNNIVFTKVEVSPSFTGGQEAWIKYLRSNLNANTPLDEGWKAGKYTVIVKFIVHSDGTLSDIITENYKGSKTAQHCIEIIKSAPKWQPAVQNGKKVNAYHKQPITFMITDQ